MMQANLFGKPMPKAPSARVHREWMPDAMEACEVLPWTQHWMPARPGQPRVKMPRLEWLASTVPGASYRYSGVEYQAADLRPYREVLGWMDAASEVAGVEFNAVFANLYRTGSDSIGWHRDNEPVLGPTAKVVIASLSFGHRRRFVMRENGNGSNRHEWSLGNGDLLVMGPGCQSGWDHSVPKTAKPVGPRAVFTFRRLV